MNENSVSGCLVRVREWLPSVPPGDYPSHELALMLPGNPPPRNVLGYVLKLCGAKLWRTGAVRWVTIPADLAHVEPANQIGRPSVLPHRRTVAVRLANEQSAWVARSARQQGNTEASVIRAAIADAMQARP
jgi:hypothetical protein